MDFLVNAQACDTSPESLYYISYRFGEQGVTLSRTITRIIQSVPGLQEDQVKAIIDGWVDGNCDLAKYNEDMRAGADLGHRSEIPF